MQIPEMHNGATSFSPAAALPIFSLLGNHNFEVFARTITVSSPSVEASDQIYDVARGTGAGRL
jgi:hypothetical protein